MNDDELLKALRETVRAEERSLRAVTPNLPPSDDAFLDRMTDFSLRQLSAPSAPTNALSDAEPTLLGKPHKLPRRTAWLWPLAAAAAILLFFLPKIEPDAPLAQYRVEIVQGSERFTRDTMEVQSGLPLRADHPFELTLRPASKTLGPLGTLVYLSQRRKLSVVPVDVEVTPLGVVHVRGKLPHTLDPNAEDSYLLVKVGRPDALPKPSDPTTQEETHPSTRIQAFRIEIRARQP